MSVLKCKKCKLEFKQYTSIQNLCFDCTVKKAKEIVQKEREKKWKKEKSIIKEKLKTVTDYRKEARYWFQRFIRLRDVGKSCISCDVKLSSITKFDAGHYYSASGTPQLLFNEFNCSGQCVFCNQHKSGNLIEYRKGIIKRYGIKVLNELETLADDKSKRVISKEYYIEIAEKYKKLCKQIEQ